MHELEQLDPMLLDTWALSFRARTWFKRLAVVSVGLSLIVALSWCATLVGSVRRERPSAGERTLRRIPSPLPLAAIATLVLAGTSIVGDMFYEALSGWWLLGHMVAAGIFLVALPWFGIVSGRAGQLRASGGLFVVAGVVVSGTMVASMFPWFGTETMEWFLSVHRYSGYATALFLLVLVVTRTMASARRP